MVLDKVLDRVGLGVGKMVLTGALTFHGEFPRQKLGKATLKNQDVPRWRDVGHGYSPSRKKGIL